jgi:hypothetical protein
VTNSTASWNYATATIRQVRATPSNRVEFVIGVSEDNINATATEMASAVSGVAYTGIGVDSTSAFATNLVLMGSGGASGEVIGVSAFLNTRLSVGYHAINWLEKGSGAGTNTWTGASETGLTVHSRG